MTTSSEARAPGCLTLGGLALLLGWALFLPPIIQYAVVTTAWLGDVTKIGATTQQIMAFSYLHPLAMLPLLLGLLLPGPRHRAVALTLLAATLCAALLMLPRVLLPPTAVYSPALLRLGIALICALPLLALAWRNRATTATNAPERGSAQPIAEPGWRALGGLPAALLCAALFFIPWVRLGALGDWLDTLLGLGQGLALGLLAAGLLGGLLLPGLRAQSGGYGWDLALGGLTLAAALAGIGGAFGQDDIQALLMLALPAAAFAAAGVALPGADGRTRLLAPALLTGLSAAAPLMFADPEEVALIVALSNDTYKYTQQAATWAPPIGLALWAAFQARAGLRAGAPLVAGAAALAWLGVGALYATGGQAGTYGNDFLVIYAQQADLSPAAQIADLTERRRFVYTTLVAQADSSQAELRRLLDARGVPYTPFYLLNAVEVQGDALLREEVARLPGVDRVIFSQRLRPLPEEQQPDPGFGGAPNDVAWGVEAIGADRVWEEFGARGQGVVVGQSDSGADWQHPALRDAYRGSDGASVSHDYNWLDPWTGRAEPWDGNGHGTHTIGTVLGAGGIGVAPEATWFGCANLVRNIGNPADYLHCMQFMLAPYPQGGDPLRDGDPARAADVSTNSWGCPPIEGCDEASLLPAVRALRAAGIFFVAAAGNEGAACDSLRTPPGNYAALMSVGAIDESGELADFSSRGPETASPDGRTGPTLLAPGVDVLSAWPGGGYNATSGTSMATPHVAGVVALVWSAAPELKGDIDATERILIESAAPYEGSYTGCEGAEAMPSSESGYGVVDAYAAVRMALGR